MGAPFLPDFVAGWRRMRERYLADPGEHGVRHARLVKLWKRFGGRCHLCGLRVPHPIHDIDAVGDDNAPTADHATPRADGVGAAKPSGSPPRWCNVRRHRLKLCRSPRRTIRPEVG